MEPIFKHEQTKKNKPTRACIRRSKRRTSNGADVQTRADEKQTHTYIDAYENNTNERYIIYIYITSLKDRPS